MISSSLLKLGAPMPRAMIRRTSLRWPVRGGVLIPVPPRPLQALRLLSTGPPKPCKQSVFGITRPCFKRLYRSNTWHEYNRYYKNTNWDKLKIPALFTAVFCVGTTLIVPYLFDYTPLSHFKRYPSQLIYALIGFNVGIFLAWRVPRLQMIMYKFFLLSKDSLRSPFAMLGSAFSHQLPMHIFVNMFVLSSFGTSLCAMVGAANFLTMYLNSAVIASFFSLCLPLLAKRGLVGSSLGASGAVFSVVGAFSYLIPNAPISLFFIPVPGGTWLFFLGSVAYNVLGFALRWGKYDYAAHIGGSIAGLAYGWWYTKEIRAAQRKREVRFGF